MARPYVFPCETTLYHPSEGARVFPAGETDPGDAWHDSPGGAPADKTTTKSALKDLIKAQDQLDTMGAQLVSKDHDLAVLADERDAANGRVADLEQRAIAAEKAAAEAIEGATELRRERDQARADHQRVSDQFTEARGAAETAKATIERLTGELATANQALADANGGAEKPAKPAKGKKAADAEEIPVNPAEIGAEPPADA